MKTIVKGVKWIAIFLLPLMLFIFIYRLALGKTNYLPVLSVFSAFEDIDVYKPINNLFDVLVNTFKDFSDFGDNFANINDISSFFSAIGDLFHDIWGVLILPVNLLIELVKTFVDYLLMFYNFITFIINY